MQNIRFYDFLDLPKKPPKVYKWPRLKIGRICFTCRFRVKRKGNFIICKYNNKSRPIWEKGHCGKWRLTTDRRRLHCFEKYVDFGKLADNPYIRNMYYKKYTNINVRMHAPIKLGRCCFLCAKRSTKERSMVHCDERSDNVWEKAVCQDFKLTDDHRRLQQYKKYMNKTGIDTTGYRWIRG